MQERVIRYLFIFADPDNPSQLPWSTIQRLCTHCGHKSVDLYMLFPYEMAIRRMASYSRSALQANAPALTTFYGDESWRECLKYRNTNAQSSDFGRCMIDAYLQRLRSVWKYAHLICDVRRGNNIGLYKMLFASNHTAGRDIATWARKHMDFERSQQYHLL